MAFLLSNLIDEIVMAPPFDQSSPSQLETILLEQISAEGPIPFSKFMETCLYHPAYGYYMANRQRIGRDGDFFTSSSVHALFGQLIAKQIHQMWEILERPANFVIAEQGAGTGHLALDLLNAFETDFPDFYDSMQYCLIEISVDNRCRQTQLLLKHQGCVRWCQRNELAGMVGCYLSNELVDAFPVHLVEKHNGQLQEVFVTATDGSFQEVLKEPSSAELAQYLNWVGVELVDGNRAEINLSAPLWIRDVANLLQRGFVLTIDYGYLAHELFAPWRTGGTLMCYFQHTSSENPYLRIGEQDITAHVDFSALIKAGEERGLHQLFYGDQCKFLLGLGFVDALLKAQVEEQDPHRAQALRLTLKNLILPDGGMGEIFKVLIQGKGVGHQDLLCARSLRELAGPAGAFM
jgi:SAM-dependent MidA family methyltransferase